MSTPGNPLPRPRRGREQLDSRVTAFFSTATALLLLLALSAAAQAMRPAIGHAAESAQPAYAELWPQQWQFFSDFADRDSVTASTVDESGSAATPLTVSHASLADAWGLEVSADAFTDDLFSLARTVPAGAWHRCGALGRETCRRAALGVRPITVVDRYGASELCGPRLLELDGPEQSAALGFGRAVLETVRVTVVCPTGR